MKQDLEEDKPALYTMLNKVGAKLHIYKHFPLAQTDLTL